MARILIIDDDVGTRTSVGQALTSAGHEVVLASDGEQGIQLHRLKPVDLVITDLFMPKKEGIETITELSKEFPQLAIIAMSGGNPASGPMLAVAGMLGDVRILEKPFDTQTLLHTVEEALR